MKKKKKSGKANPVRTRAVKDLSVSDAQQVKGGAPSTKVLYKKTAQGQHFPNVELTI